MEPRDIGILVYWYVGILVLEYWNTMEYWNIRILGKWNIGILVTMEPRYIGILEYWNNMECWNIGILGKWDIGILQFGQAQVVRNYMLQHNVDEGS